MNHFAYYLGRWRKANKASAPVSFMDVAAVNIDAQAKWVLNVAEGISLEVPQTVSMPQS